MKNIIRTAYRFFTGVTTLAALPFRGRAQKIAVSYGGARSGDYGGTLVKIRLLQKHFPERRLGYSLFYLLSNAIYLPQFVIDQIKRSGVPVVFNQNGVFYPGWYPDRWERENARMAGVHAAADYVFYQSEFCKRCAEKFLGRRSGKSEVLFNAVDTGHFAPSKSVSGFPYTFLVTGKFGETTAYRLSSSVAGLAAARRGGLDIRLTIAGLIDRNVEAAIRNEVERLEIQGAVKFIGPYSNVEAPNVYRSANAYLMTKYNDPCPNTVLEAMASGLPILYSDSGGVPEQVGAQAGIALPMPETFETDLAPNAEEIARGMAQVIKDHDRMAVAARARAVERFDLAHWLARHEAIFRVLLGMTQ